MNKTQEDLLFQINVDKIKIIAFELYGTLVDIPKNINPYYELWKKKKKYIKYDNYLKATEEKWNFYETGARWGVPFFDVQRLDIELEKILKHISLFPDVLEIIDYLHKKGLKVAVCANIAQPYLFPAKWLLKNYVDYWVNSFQIKKSKPHPDFFQISEQKIGYSKKEICFISHHIEDLKAGHEFGWQVIELKNEKINDLNKDKLLNNKINKINIKQNNNITDKNNDYCFVCVDELSDIKNVINV